MNDHKDSKEFNTFFYLFIFAILLALIPSRGRAQQIDSHYQEVFSHDNQLAKKTYRNITRQLRKGHDQRISATP